jgi:hypothetical protein
LYKRVNKKIKIYEKLTLMNKINKIYVKKNKRINKSNNCDWFNTLSIKSTCYLNEKQKNKTSNFITVIQDKICLNFMHRPQPHISLYSYFQIKKTRGGKVWIIINF